MPYIRYPGLAFCRDRQHLQPRGVAQLLDTGENEMNNVANKPVFGYCISALIVLAATVMPAFADVTIKPSSTDWDGTKPCSGADDTARIRHALRTSSGTVRFESEVPAESSTAPGIRPHVSGIWKLASYIWQHPDPVYVQPTGVCY